MENRPLGIFDVDGTIRANEGLPREVIKGFRNLYDQNVITTILTGRGYTRMREALGLDFSRIARKPSPIGLENGARISSWGGTKNIIYHPLHRSEIAAVVDATFKEAVDFVAYFPEQPRRKAVVWTPRREKVEEYHSKYGHFAVVTHSAPSLFERKANIDKPGMLAIKPSVNGWSELLAPDINMTTNEGSININTQGINKGSGLIEIRELLGIHPEHVIFAGNDHNDLSAFSANISGTNLLVGNDLSGLISVPYIQINSVSGLGRYLQGYNRI